MLHVETVLPDTLALLKRIQAMPELSAMRLVGGTALALYKMEDATSTGLRMLDRRLERLRSGSGRVLPMAEAFAELDARIAR